MHANAPSPSHHESRRVLETSITDVGCADLYKHTYFITRHDCVSEIETYLQQGVLEEMCFDQLWPDPDAGNFISQKHIFWFAVLSLHGLATVDIRKYTSKKEKLEPVQVNTLMHSIHHIDLFTSDAI